MYKILLVCNAGMSTSMLVQRMERPQLKKESKQKLSHCQLPMHYLRWMIGMW